MILLMSIIIFFFVFFLSLSIVNICRFEEREFQNKIRARLERSDRPITEIKLEKKERLSDVPLLNRLLQKITKIKNLQNFIDQSGLSISVGVFILGSLFLGAGCLFLMILSGAHLILSLMISFTVIFIPVFYVSFKRSSRRKLFSSQFADSIALIASSLRAGYSLQMAIDAVTEERKDIVAFEFGKVLSEVEVGQNFEEALKGMLKRIDTHDLRLFISAVILQRETGGNLAELLDNLENVIRERQELRRELSAATAQARLSGTVLSLLPVFVGFFIFIINRDYIMFFFNDAIGTKLLIFCFMGQMMGMLTIRKIVKLDF